MLEVQDGGQHGSASPVPSCWEANAHAVAAANPSNARADEEDEWVEGMIPGGRDEGEAGDVDLELTVGSAVEVAARWRYRGDSSRVGQAEAVQWSRAWVLRVHSDGSMDVVFVEDGTLEEHVPKRRLQPGRHAAFQPAA
mmetsp:Transcript_96035/g.222630  ORF Transcript_96035/g.222630 Transcript_96035/m.222630 type:complete len:139 (-) Transcript_96035:42-458(-)